MRIKGIDVLAERAKTNPIIKPGNWDVYLEGYSRLFEGYIKISNTLNYRIQ